MCVCGVCVWCGNRVLVVAAAMTVAISIKNFIRFIKTDRHFMVKKYLKKCYLV